MNLRDMFVEDPIKKETSDNELIIHGTFICMNCEKDIDRAVQKDGKMSWKCDECNYVSTIRGIL